MATKRYNKVTTQQGERVLQMHYGNMIRTVHWENDEGIGRAAGGSYWTPQKIASKLLYWGKISEISAGQMPNKVTGATDFITVGGSAGSYTFQVPNTAPYIAADTDYIWFKTDETPRTTTEAELIGYDLPRTPVKYDNTTPYAIREIIILKAGETLTTAEENAMRDYMQLSWWWSNTLSFHGVEKQNRGIGQSIWTPESVYTYDARTLELVATMTGLGDTVTDGKKLAIDTAIVALKAAGLFDTQFDRFIVRRNAAGRASAKLNWVSDNFDDVEVPNGGTLGYTANGFTSDGTKSYLRSNYNPNTNKVNLSLDSASYLIKVSGAMAANGVNEAFGCWDGTNGILYLQSHATTIFHRINCTTALPGPNNAFFAAGYNLMSRDSSTLVKQYNGATSYGDIASNSLAIGNREMFSLCWNNSGTPTNFTASTTITELECVGKKLSAAQFATIISIMDTFFTS